MHPSSLLLGRTFLGRQSQIRLGAVRPLGTVDQRAMAVGDGFRLSCSESDESDDDVLSVVSRAYAAFVDCHLTGWGKKR